MKNKYKEAIDWIREQLKEGATIRATDPEGRILDFGDADGRHVKDDERIYGGLTIDYSKKK